MQKKKSSKLAQKQRMYDKRIENRSVATLAKSQIKQITEMCETQKQWRKKRTDFLCVCLRRTRVPSAGTKNKMEGERRGVEVVFHYPPMSDLKAASHDFGFCGSWFMVHASKPLRNTFFLLFSKTFAWVWPFFFWSSKSPKAWNQQYEYLFKKNTPDSEIWK